MRSAIGWVFVGFMLAACGSAPLGARDGVAYGVVEQPAHREPPPDPRCAPGQSVCGVVCVDLARDNANCGVCDERCDVGAGMFCHRFTCVSVEEFGFEIHPRGPRSYDPAADAPRPGAP
jgi:hypothetical protein